MGLIQLDQGSPALPPTGTGLTAMAPATAPHAERHDHRRGAKAAPKLRWLVRVTSLRNANHRGRGTRCRARAIDSGTNSVSVIKAKASENAGPRDLGPPRRSTARCAEPCPSKTSATRQPSRVHDRRSASGRGRCRRDTPSAAPVESARRRPVRGRRERADRPPGRPSSAALARPRRARNEAAPRSIGACRRRPRPPTSVEELLLSAHQVGRAGADPLRVAEHDVRAGRQLVQQQLQVVDEHRRQRLHALDGIAAAIGSSSSASSGCSLQQLGRPGPHSVGQQQLAARRRPQPVLGDLERALVGDLEVADLLDLVAPELDPQRVLLGRREDVEDAAAHGEVAALLDQLDAGVAGRDQSRDDRRSRSAVVAGAQLDRLQLAEARHLRLQHRAHRRHDDRSRPAPGRRRSGAPAGAARPAAARRCRRAGESRSCGSVSQPPGRARPGRRVSRQRSASTRSSASRPVAVTASTGRPAPPRRRQRATTNGRSAGGADSSSEATPAEETAWVRAGSGRTAASSPDSVMAAASLPGAAR